MAEVAHLASRHQRGKDHLEELQAEELQLTGKDAHTDRLDERGYLKNGAQVVAGGSIVLTQAEPPWIIFDVVGNAFLRSMVRSLVGSLLYVGQGLWPAEGFKTVLEARDRALAAPPAPACGLCLMQVEYD